MLALTLHPGKSIFIGDEIEIHNPVGRKSAKLALVVPQHIAISRGEPRNARPKTKEKTPSCRNN